MQEAELKKQFSEKAKFVNDTLRELLAKQVGTDSSLAEAMRYVLESGGKRIRSALVLWCCEVVAGEINRDAEIAAAAIEMVHAYSLVHDDLPSMDDDDIRRGKPTCHKAFDEATAILTGDALLTLAFGILAGEISNPEISVELISQLASSAGASGMIAGQMADLRAENTGGSEELLEYIHTNKTAKMFRCAAAMGAICGGSSREQFSSLCEYGLKIGLGFQVSDDILDVCGTSEQLGKTAGKDAKADKCTYPSVVGLEKSKRLSKQLADEAIAALEPLGDKADILRRLATVLFKRTQ